MPTNWEGIQREPNLLEMIEDPIIQALMQYDRVTEEEFPPLVEAILSMGLQPAGA